MGLYTPRRGVPAELADVFADALVDVAHVVLVAVVVGEGLAAGAADDLVALPDVPLHDVRLQVLHHLWVKNKIKKKLKGFSSSIGNRRLK